jgi:hypothetical protein
MRKVEAESGIAAGRDVEIDFSPMPVAVATINGGTNIIGARGPVNVHVTNLVPKTPRRRVVTPAANPLNAEQCGVIYHLCHEWVALSAAIKKRPLTLPGAWGQINRKGGAASYREIDASKFDLVCSFIRQQMAMLRAMPSAAKKDDDWRASRIRSIKARCKNQLGDERAYADYIRKNFKAESLTELATDELRRTYSYIMAKKAT